MKFTEEYKDFKYTTVDVKARFMEIFADNNIVHELCRMGVINELCMRDYLIVIDLKRMVYDDGMTYSKAVAVVVEKSNLTQKWVREIFNRNKKMKILNKSQFTAGETIRVLYYHFQ